MFTVCITSEMLLDYIYMNNVSNICIISPEIFLSDPVKNSMATLIQNIAVKIGIYSNSVKYWPK